MEHLTKHQPKQITCDVLVAGGGSAGMAAAISAARTGARVVLVERHGFLGGMGTAALVHTLCGLFLLRDDGADLCEANPGFATEFASRLKEIGGASDPVRMGRVDVMRHDPWAFACLADQMVAECSTLELFTHTEICSVNGDEQGWEVGIVSRGTRMAINARAVVDTTGDAAFTALAGLEVGMVEPERLQRPAYIIKFAGVVTEQLGEQGRLRLAHGIAQAVKAGQLPAAALGCGFRPGLNSGECYLTLDMEGGGELYDPLSPSVLSKMEAMGRGMSLTLHKWLAAHVDGFQHSWIAMWPARAGVRESRRIKGSYTLTAADILEGSCFDDGIAQIGWPLELREKATGPKWQFPQAGTTPAQIPLVALQHAEHKNLFAAGRCLSATHEALASVRVMGTCMATGEAAGIAAALLDDQKALDVIRALRMDNA